MTEVTQGAHSKHTNGTDTQAMTSKGAEKENDSVKSSERPKAEKRQSQSSATGEDGASKKDSPKKRRKVNHGELHVESGRQSGRSAADFYTACIYCRRSVSMHSMPSISILRAAIGRLVGVTDILVNSI